MTSLERMIEEVLKLDSVKNQESWGLHTESAIKLAQACKIMMGGLQLFLHNRPRSSGCFACDDACIDREILKAAFAQIENLMEEK